MAHPVAQNLELRGHYLLKHQEVYRPLETFTRGVSIIVGVAIAFFSCLPPGVALCVGIGSGLILSGLLKVLFNRLPTSLNVNQRAADALLSPGFFEAALAQNRRWLSSAENIIQAHRNYVELGQI